jgi:hypothetical protein
MDGNLEMVKKIVENNLMGPLDDMHSISKAAAVSGRLPVMKYAFKKGDLQNKVFGKTTRENQPKNMRYLPIVGVVQNRHVDVVDSYTPLNMVQAVSMRYLNIPILQRLHEIGKIDINMGTTIRVTSREPSKQTM